MAFATFTGVNDTALHVAVSEWIIERLIQDQIYRDGLGITEITIKDMGAGGVRVPKVKPSTGKWRKLGATNNGGWFDDTAITAIGLDEEFIEFLFQYDQAEDVPVSQQKLSLGGVSSVQVRAREIGKNITIGMNSATMATQMVAVINAVITAGAETDKILTYDPTTDGEALTYMLAGSELLNDGDGVYHAYYPQSGRIWILRPSVFTDLRKKGSVIVGGSNFAQEILASGAIDVDVETLPEINRGYRGMLDGIPVFMASSQLWTEAEKWMGQSAGYLHNIAGILCSHIATGRGQAFPDQTKVIDSPVGQGLRIQPLSNFGTKVFFEGGIKLLASGTFQEGSVPLEILPEGSDDTVATTAVVITGLETVAVGADITMTATVAPSLDGSKYAVMWSSADETKFTVGTTYGFTTVSTCVVTGVAADAGTVLTAQIMAITYPLGVKTYTALSTPQTDTVSIATTE
jgi:hypothetical protein